jgi:hypothetical protein
MGWEKRLCGWWRRSDGDGEMVVEGNVSELRINFHPDLPI